MVYICRKTVKLCQRPNNKKLDKIRLEILGLTNSHAAQGSFALVLGEADGNRRLPIIIGMFEAQAIALEMEKITSNRPMTHDLFKNFSKSFDIQLTEVIISKLRDGIFYADMHFRNPQGQEIVLDSRPSDAIAIAIRFDAPIFVLPMVLEDAGISIDVLEEEIDQLETEEDDPEIEERQDYASPQIQSSPISDTPFSNTSTERLYELMQEAIESEDYERAAQIRDEINKRTS